MVARRGTTPCQSGTRFTIRWALVAGLPVPRPLLHPEPVQLILLLIAVLPLRVDRVQAIRCSGRRCAPGTLISHQKVAALVFLQYLLLLYLVAVQLIIRGWRRGRFACVGGDGGFLEFPEFLLAGTVRLHQLRHAARCLLARCRQVQCKTKCSQQYGGTHLSSSIAGTSFDDICQVAAVHVEMPGVGAVVLPSEGVLGW